MTEETSVRNKVKSIIIKKTSHKPGIIEELLQKTESSLNNPQVPSSDLPVPKLTLELFSSTSLEQFQEFRTLRDSLKAYLVDSQKPEPSLHKEKPELWKKILYSSLYKLLNECVYTLSSQQQYSYLLKIHDWYFSKLGQEIPKSASASSQVSSFYPNVSLRTQEKKSSSVSPGSNSKKMTFFPSVEEDLQVKLDSFYLENRTKELKEKRIRDQMITRIKGWAKNRPRMSEEHSRSFETARYASRIDKRAVMKEPVVIEKPKNLYDFTDFDINATQTTAVTKEAEVSKSFEAIPPISRVSSIRKKNRRFFDYEGFNDEPRNILDYDSEAVTIGTYSRGKNEMNRPQTSFFHDRILKGKDFIKNKRSNFEEITEVKQTLARNNILCGIETLKNGLILSEDLPPDKLGATWIPPAGSGLLIYPVNKSKSVVKTKRRKK